MVVYCEGGGRRLAGIVALYLAIVFGSLLCRRSFGEWYWGVDWEDMTHGPAFWNGLASGMTSMIAVWVPPLVFRRRNEQ